MIPKIIHYCWYGGREKPAVVMKCIASWKKYFPDYEIREWNESNTDLQENKYIAAAYKARKWAFVSDFVRMKVLYQYGGVYFDTDVQVLKPFPTELFELHSFSGIEEFSQLVNPGLVYACNASDSLVRAVLDTYKDETFDFKDVASAKTINMRLTEILDQHGYVHENIKQEVAGLTVFPSEVFCAYDGEMRRPAITEQSLSVHLYAHTWFPWWRRVRLFFGTIRRRVMARIRS